VRTVICCHPCIKGFEIADFRSTTEIWQSSKLPAFRSLQMHHINHKGAIFQTSKMLWLPTWSLQLANNFITFLGITHFIPKRRNSTTHNSLVTLAKVFLILFCFIFVYYGKTVSRFIVAIADKIRFEVW